MHASAHAGARATVHREASAAPGSAIAAGPGLLIFRASNSDPLPDSRALIRDQSLVGEEVAVPFRPHLTKLPCGARTPLD